VMFASFIAWERRAPAPMLPLDLFKRRNFAIGNVETFAMYGGLGLLFFLLILFLQQVAGFSAIEAGTSTLPVTIVMFLLSKRFGALADRLGPRLFMGVGPIVAALGLLMFVRLDADVNYLTDLLPGLLLFSLGLSMTVAPLTATVLADADEHNAGIASAVNNAIARTAGLVAIAAVGTLVAAQFSHVLESRLGPSATRPEVARAVKQAEKQPLAVVKTTGSPPAVALRVERSARQASVSAFRLGMAISAGLVALGGVLALVGIVNPRRRLEASTCPGGQLAGVPREGAAQSPCDWAQEQKLPRGGAQLHPT
jgi:Major Facilitator Superfamily